MIEDLAERSVVYADGWSRAGDSTYLKETRQDVATWVESVLEEIIKME